jgi:hypothetical protein
MLVNSRAITDDLLRLAAQARANRVMREAEALNSRDRVGACDTTPVNTHRRGPHAKGV